MKVLPRMVSQTLEDERNVQMSFMSSLFPNINFIAINMNQLGRVYVDSCWSYIHTHTTHINYVYAVNTKNTKKRYYLNLRVKVLAFSTNFMNFCL